MKLRNSLAILVFSSAFLLASCGGGNNPGGESTTQEQTTSEQSSQDLNHITVTFDTAGGSAIAPQVINKGGHAERPADPTRDGYVFVNWYVDAVYSMEFDFEEALYSDTTIYAGWDVDASASTEESSGVDTSGYLYFREASWWNSPTGFPKLAVNDAGLEGEEGNFTAIDYELLLDMEYVLTIKEGDEYSNIYKIALEEIEDATSLRILRCGPKYVDDQPTEENDYWGACTVAFDPSTRGDNDMYDLSLAAKPAAWTDEGTSREAEGQWSIFDPTYHGDEEDSSDASGEDSSDTSYGDYYGPDGSESVDWWIVGEGANFTGWSQDTGVQLFSNPNSETDKGCILNLGIEEGDVFQVSNGTTWYGWDKVDQWDDPSNAGKSNFEGVDNGFGQLTNIKCIVSGVYDIYVNKDGNFWIQLHA